MFGLAIIGALCLLLGLVYPMGCTLLYLVYKATGGKLGFRQWWEKMDF